MQRFKVFLCFMPIILAVLWCVVWLYVLRLCAINSIDKLPTLAAAMLYCGVILGLPLAAMATGDMLHDLEKEEKTNDKTLPTQTAQRKTSRRR